MAPLKDTYLTQAAYDANLPVSRQYPVTDAAQESEASKSVAINVCVPVVEGDMWVETHKPRFAFGWGWTTCPNSS